MGKLIALSTLLLLAACGDPVYADNHLTETRYCGEPARNKDGSIKRNRAVVEAFERIYPLPAEYKREDWQIDHVIPLSMGGCDSVSNMQWLPESIKTCADDHCKDRFERVIY